MARPAGRYFASVITKIRDAKKKELIVIDEGFKMQLRQQLMVKIAATSQPQKTSWLEKLAPFKAYLGVVPALAFVIIAVVGISKLPLQFKSDVVVPVGPSSQQNASPKAVVQDQGSPSQDNAANSSSIITFPGRFVIPQGKNSDAAANLVGENQPSSLAMTVSDAPADTSVQKSGVPQDSSQKQQTPLQVQSSDSSDSIGNLNVPQQILQYFTYQPVTQPAPVSQYSETAQDGASADAGSSASVTLAPSVEGSAPLNSADPSVTGSMPSVTALKTPADVSKESSTALMNTENSAGAAADQPLKAATVVQKSEVYTPQRTAKTAPKTVTSATYSLNEMAQLPPKQVDLDVYYNGSFSGDERTVLEQSIVPHLVDGKDVDYVSVYQKDAATVVIELQYADGKTAVYDYKVDQTGTLQLVQQ